MLRESRGEPQTFITVAAWLFVVIGAYDALVSFQQLILWIFFFSPGSPPISMTFISSVSLLFGIGALLCGIGMLNRREKALGRSIVFLWTYVAWLVIGFVWSVSELIMESIESSGRASNFLAETERFGVASTISWLIVSIITCLACIWLARRLSRPLIKTAYAA